MNKRVCNAVLCIGALLACFAAHALEITDDNGTVVQVARTPQRIVSLLPSLAETVCALGQCARLVGVDRYSNFPEAVRRLPKVGGGLDPSIEAVVALKPDVVLIATSSPALQRLRSLGLTVLAFEPKTHADVQRVLLALGRLLGVADADRVWRDIQAALAVQVQRMPAAAKGARVYFEVSTSPHAAGAASFIGQTLQGLGLQNIVPASMGVFPKLNPEFIVRADPDVVMVGDGAAAGLGQRPGWSSMRALKDRKVCVFTPAQSDAMVRAGPRLAEGAASIVQCLAQLPP